MELGLNNIVSAIAAAIMIFGGVVPYIPQYREINKTQNADGFSTYVCLILLVANILRILFWFGHPFELPLLVQSFVMCITMLTMVYLCVTVRYKHDIIPTRQASAHDSEESSEKSSDTSIVDIQLDNQKTEISFWDLSPRYFWKWTNFFSYIEFLLVFSVSMAVITYTMLDISIYVETLGFCALMFEAMLGAPQFYRNCSNRSTRGMSVSMVLMWSSGDIFKTVYFIIRAAPMQFWLCGLLQVTLDFAILSQVVFYGSGPKTAVQ